jgi:hypothetical protein
MTSSLFFSCKKENMKDCIKSKGDETNQIRILPNNIDSVFLGNRLNFTIIQDSANFAVIKAGKNLIDLIVTQVDGTTLVINDNNKCNWVRDLREWPEVELHLKSVRIFATRGTNNIKSDSQFLGFPELIFDLWEHNGSLKLFLENEMLYIRQHTGASDVEISGRCNNLRVYMAGTCKGDYSNLSVMSAEIDQRSSGSMTASVIDALFVSIFGDGNVTVRGNPEVKKLERIGRGELILND